MIFPKAKILGLIALTCGGKILLDASRGQASDGASTLSNSVGGSDKLALGISFAIGLTGVVFGLRALFTDKVCLGEDCEVDQQMNGY